MNYYQIPIFYGMYFEDSYVLGMTEVGEILIFYLEVVLTEKHPAYALPKPGEKYCYKRGVLEFSGINNGDRYIWDWSASAEISEDVDYGNIDVFKLDNDVFTLCGDWGLVKFKCSGIRFFWEDF